jgi:hypothetical protein
MSSTHDVISALLDDEPFDPEELREALDDPAGRALLIDLVALRRIVQPRDVASALVAPGAARHRWWQVAAAPPREDIEVTLKPGESRPIDSVSVRQADAKTVDGKPCTTKATSLRVTADFPDMDRRLFGADLWLVERLPNGTEFVQAQSVRGLFNRPIPFYFDSKSDGTKRLDFFGKLVADPVQGGFAVSIEAIRAVANPDVEYGYQATRWFRSTLHVKSNEVVDVALPVPKDKNTPLADRAFSIRIKPRQIR